MDNLLVIALPIAVSLIGIVVNYISEILLGKQKGSEIRDLKIEADRDPSRAKPAWDLARAKLEAYFDRNLRQVTAIFWLTLFVMTIGFGIIAWGIYLSVLNPDETLPAIITGFAGVITELIGATFILVYKSTMAQASDYTRTLERINSVGMAMYILDNMPDDSLETSLKNSSKAKLVNLIMQQSAELINEKVN